MLVLCYWETTGICGSTERWVVTDPYHTWEEQPHVPFRGGHKAMGWGQASRLFVAVFEPTVSVDMSFFLYEPVLLHALNSTSRGSDSPFFILHANILFKHFQDALWWSVTGFSRRLFGTDPSIFFDSTVLVLTWYRRLRHQSFVWYLSFHRLGSSLTAELNIFSAHFILSIGAFQADQLTQSHQVTVFILLKWFSY